VATKLASQAIEQSSKRQQEVIEKALHPERK